MAKNDHLFVGWALLEYQESRGFDQGQMAAWLECSEEDFTKLALCRLPDDRREGFQRQLAQIAGYSQCNKGRLLLLIREVAALSTLRGKGTAGELLLAARDRKASDLPKS
jgi:hypothetical protein